MSTPDQVTISLSNKNFLPIVDKAGITYYGGHQSWFDRFTQSFGGCGPVAAANIVAYMATNISELSHLYRFNKEYITKADFFELMEEVYQYVTPREIPILNTFSDKKASKVGIPSLGITSLTKYAVGVENYAYSKGVALRAVRNTEELNFHDAVEYIKQGLAKDSPVSLLNLLNSIDMQWKNPNTGEHTIRRLKLHWVTITGLTQNKLTDEITLEVSTWGGRAKLSFNELWDRGWRSKIALGGLVYFHLE